jgi:homeobox protein cut-like
MAELEFVSADLDRANRRAMEAEKRNEQLRSELEGLKAGHSDAKLRDQISELEGENRTLATRMERTRTSLRLETENAAKKIEALDRDVQRKADEIATLRTKLEAQSDYEEIKRELDVLKSIEFRDDNAEMENTNESGNHEASTNLEKMLLARNKQLMSDMTALRVQNSELQAECAKFSSGLADATKELERIKQLNSKLEDDLTTVHKGDGAVSVVSAWTRPAGRKTSAAGGKGSPTASIIGGGQDQGSGADPAILPIITQQRDRFRARNVELEEELRKNWITISSLRNELDRIKKDNVDLYERTRYISSYGAGPVPAATSEASVVDRYRDDYEEGLTGFQMFRTQETERLLSRMGPLERVSYTFTRFVMATRQSRKLFFLYTVAVHCILALVFMYGGVSPTVPVVPAAITKTGTGVGKAVSGADA